MLKVTTDTPNTGYGFRRYILEKQDGSFVAAFYASTMPGCCGVLHVNWFKTSGGLTKGECEEIMELLEKRANMNQNGQISFYDEANGVIERHLSPWFKKVSTFFNPNSGHTVSYFVRNIGKPPEEKSDEG
jgi:hypothetical protein